MKLHEDRKLGKQQHKEEGQHQHQQQQPILKSDERMKGNSREEGFRET